MFEDMLVRREDILEDLEETTDPKERGSLRDQLQKIDKILGNEVELGEDDLIDEWERDLEAGRSPDLGRKPE